MASKDCCPRAILGVKDDATYKEIRRAYRARLLRVHPDHGGTATDLTEVIEAYKSLLAEVPKVLSPERPSSTQLYEPLGRRSCGGRYSVAAAQRYAQTSGAIVKRGFVTAPVDIEQYDDATGFAGILNRAIRRVEKLQVDLLVPDYSI